MKRKALIIFLLTFAAWTSVLPVSIAETQETDTAVEYKIKAAFLLNFAKFINWPANSFSGDEQLFKICVLGKNPFGSALSAIESRTIGNRNIDLRYFDNVEQVADCHLLFISDSEKNNLHNIFRVLGDHPIITVSDINGFSGSGGIIEFVTKDNKLAFIINLSRAREQGFVIHSALLDLATEVIQ
jgi:hypothetical protein